MGSPSAALTFFLVDAFAPSVPLPRFPPHAVFPFGFVRFARSPQSTSFFCVAAANQSPQLHVPGVASRRKVHEGASVDGSGLHGPNGGRRDSGVDTWSRLDSATAKSSCGHIERLQAGQQRHSHTKSAVEVKDSRQGPACLTPDNESCIARRELRK